MVARVLFPVLPCGGTRLHPHHRATIKALERYPVSFLPFPTSSTLAPTDHPASYLSSRLRLMPIGAPCGRPGGSTQEHPLSTPPTNFITLSTNSAATRVYFSGGIKPAYF